MKPYPRITTTSVLYGALLCAAPVQAMIALWDQYAVKNGVILTDDGPFKAKN